MVSLMQAQTVQQLEAEGWSIVEPLHRRATGGRVMMTRMSDGRTIYIFVMPNGERSAQSPTAAQIRDW
jgi:hypothetical protein